MIESASIEYLEIEGPDFTGRRFAVINSQQFSTGSGILRSSIMPLPGLILGLLGTRASFYLNAVSSYDPLTGEVTPGPPNVVTAMVYPESYTLKEFNEIPEVMQGDIKIYVPGVDFGYTETALLVLQVRETGGPIGRILQ